jgi:glycogen(starch) synthase
VKILMTTDTVGGVWRYVLELVSALEHLDVEVVLATMGGPLSSSQCAEIKARPNLTVHESRYKLEWMPRPWHDIERAGDWLLNIAVKTKPDVVHLNNYVHGALPWDAPVLTVGHSCVLSWWRAVHGEAAPPQWEYYREKVTRGLRGVDLVIAPTKSMLTTLEYNYSRLPEKRVVPNALAQGIRTATAKEPFILAAGRLWDEAKNIQALSYAAATLAWPTVVAGGTRHPDGWTASFPNMQVLGELRPDALVAWYARAAIYALPARYEPFGLSILEAGLCGCALVLGDIPSLREVWGDAAVFVPPDDHQALADAINRLIADAKARSCLAARARRRARTFTPKRMGNAYYAAYADLRAACCYEERLAATGITSRKTPATV